MKACFVRRSSHSASRAVGWAALGVASGTVLLLTSCSSGGSSGAVLHPSQAAQSVAGHSAADSPTATDSRTATASAGTPIASRVSSPSGSGEGKPSKGKRVAGPHRQSGEGSGSSNVPSSSPSRTGGIYQIVPARHRKTLAPVPLKKPAHVGAGVTEHIVSIKSIHAAAQGPGEVSGPALKIVIQVSNDTNSPIDLSTALMTVSDAEGTPGVEMSLNGSAPLRGELPANGHVQGTYVFTLPPTHRDPVTVNFSYSSAAPVTLFTGTVK